MSDQSAPEKASDAVGKADGNVFNQALGQAVKTAGENNAKKPEGASGFVTTSSAKETVAQGTKSS